MRICAVVWLSQAQLWETMLLDSWAPQKGVIGAWMHLMYACFSFSLELLSWFYWGHWWQGLESALWTRKPLQCGVQYTLQGMLSLCHCLSYSNVTQSSGMQLSPRGMKNGWKVSSVLYSVTSLLIRYVSWSISLKEPKANKIPSLAHTCWSLACCQCICFCKPQSCCSYLCRVSLSITAMLFCCIHPTIHISNITFHYPRLKHGPNSKFSNDNLANIIQIATENPANAFRGEGTPAVLHLVEIMGIEQSRQWGLHDEWV